MPSKRWMARISGERKLVLKRAGRTQRSVPAGASEVVLEAKAMPVKAEEVSLAAVRPDVATNSRSLSQLSLFLSLKQRRHSYSKYLQITHQSRDNGETIWRSGRRGSLGLPMTDSHSICGNSRWRLMFAELTVIDIKPNTVLLWRP